MSDYTPTTEEVRYRYVQYADDSASAVAEGIEEFNEWLKSVRAEVWEEALQYVWKLNDPAWTVFGGGLYQSDREVGVLLAADVDQARDENPYE